MMIKIKKYYAYAVTISLIYIIINLFISGFYNTIPLIIKYSATVNWVKLSVSLILTLIIAWLVGITAVTAWLKYKERKKCMEGRVTAGIGAVGGLIAGICPLCVTGILPLILSFLGVTFTFASLPLQGIEIQALAAILLMVSLKMMNKKN